MLQLLAFASISWALVPFAAAAGPYCSEAPYSSFTSYGVHSLVQSYCSASFSATTVVTTTTVSTTTTDISTETSTAPTATVTSTSISIVTTTTLKPYQERKRHAGPGPTPRNAPPKKCTPGRVNGSTCVVECGTNRPGGEYAMKKVSSFADCLQLCGRDPKCTNANYHRNDKSCSLKNSQNPARSDKDVDGAVCRSKWEATMTTSTKTTTISANDSSIIRSIASAGASISFILSFSGPLVFIVWRARV